MKTADRIRQAAKLGIKMKVLTDIGITPRKIYSISNDTPPPGCHSIPRLTSTEERKVNTMLDIIKEKL